METLFEIIQFETSSRLRSLATYLYLAAFFGLGFLVINLLTGVSGGFSITLSGIEYTNSPVAIMTSLSTFGGLGLLFAAGIFSQAACSDFETKFANILFSFPLQKREYLAGRLSGATIVVLFILLGLGLGYLVGESMPWLDREKLMPFNGLGYLNAYLYAIIPNVLIFGGFCFGVGLLTRQTLLVYLVGVALFVSGNILSGILKTNPRLAGLVDPTGLSAFTKTIEFWTPAQKATQLVPLSTEILLNRLLWLGLSGSFVAFCFSKFSFSQLVSTRSNKQRSRKELPPITPPPHLPISLSPQVHQSFDYTHQLSQLISQAWIEFQSLMGNRWFLIALAVAILPSMLISGAQLGKEMYGTPNYPLTHLLVDNAGKLYTQLFKLLIIFLAGEMIWRDRVARINPLTDTLPIRTFVLLLSKFAALAVLVVSTLLMILVSGVLVQTFLGYTRYEFDVYFTILFTTLFPELLLLSALSFFLQVVVQNRYGGYFLAALVLFGLPQLAKLPQIPSIFVYGSFPETSYSQFDGFGVTLAPVRWFQAYWGAWAVLLLTVAVLFWQRSVDESWRVRWRVAKRRFTRPVQRVMLAAVAAIVGLGSWIYYNTRVLNPIFSDKEVEKSKLAYEKNFKFLEAAQPQITDIKLRYDLYPSRRLVASGRYTLINKTNKPISKVLVSMDLDNGATVQRMSLGNLNSPTVTKTVAVNPEILVAVRTFDLPTPLLPGQTTTLNFALTWQPQGFNEKQQPTALSANGTSIDENLPHIGYFTSLELKDKKLREKYGLPKQFSELPLQQQLRERNPDRTPELVTWSVIVGTSFDQIAAVPGYLQREWVEGDRRYFEYRMNEGVRNMMPLFSARYEVKRQRWRDVNLEIYYLKGHEFNVERMMRAMQTSLEYYSKNFGLYPFRQARIFELPRGNFAFALPGTIGFAEYVGFLGRIDEQNPQGVDYASYITAHEMGHQWWGHQVIPDPNVKGNTTMDEILAQYSGLMVMSKLYGPEKISHILKTELDWYFQGRESSKEEEPLITTDASYVYYRKGAVVMYALKDYIGEENLNRALAKYLQERSKYSENVPPYPTVMDLIGYFQEATPPNLRFLISDLFESIILYNAQAKSAIATKRPDGKYEVKLTVSIQKFQSDKKGNETLIDLNPNETADIGVFGKNGKFLYLQKHQLKAGDNTISVVVDAEPEQVGIDPMYKLLNRSFQSNTVIVSKNQH
jgi:hypothetical protein